MEEITVKTHLTDTIEDSPTTRYDENAKELLSDKNLLAHILAGVVDEFEGWEIEDIIPCIEGEPEVSNIPVSRTPCISGSNTEDIVINENKITYDIRFNVVVPKENGNEGIMCIKLLIDVEMQAKVMGLGYNLLNRAMYSVSRMVSSQNNREFVYSDYDNIKKVYSIWICANPMARYRNTILRYSMKEDILYGMVKPSNIDSLLNIVMINLNGNKSVINDEETNPTLVGLLNTIFTSPLNSEEKLHKLESVYNIPRTMAIERGVGDMCNFSTLIEERGIRKGKIEGKIEGRIESLYYDGGKSVEEIAEIVLLPVEYVLEVLGL